MFTIHLFPLILEDLCSLEVSGARQGHHGPLGGVAQPHHEPADVAPPVPPHQSMGVAKKHTLKLIPLLVSSRCKIKG
jgi:hypothetical protein